MRKHWIKGGAALLCSLVLWAAGGMTAYGENTGAASETVSETEAAAVTADGSITSCLIIGSGDTIEVKAQSNGQMENTDSYLYLFELKPYEDSIGGRTDYAAWAEGGTSATFSLSLNRGSASDRLYSKFVLAVKTADGYQEISKPHYITNPEVVAPNQAPYKAKN